MRLEDAETGRKVIYTPYEGCDPKIKEEGVITSKNNHFVFVRYGSSVHSQATNPADIEYIV